MSRNLIALVVTAWMPWALASPAGLPADFDPDPSVPTPTDWFGFEPGQRHPRHDQIVSYLHALDEASERVEVERIGFTHGKRPLLLVRFAARERHAGLDELAQRRHQASRDGDGPPVVWLGYSVHGDEASGASAAAVIAWYLAADRGAAVRRWLDQVVILMEPVINPDGLDRFAHWVNAHRGYHPSADADDREHNEAWPSGRTNYYWFDLNRDWMPLVHPESRARMRALQQWRPHVVTDHHEMGADATFFFQPGIPERTNPLTPPANQELTARIGQFHARRLDQAGQPYYTRESFDDYYLGKGSTYPDLTGGIGILFEQASTQGHVRDSDYGRRSFADAVANQVRTSLSTLAAVDAMGEELIEYQREFFSSARNLAGSAGHAGWVLGDDGDPARAAALIDLLLAHGIEVRPLSESLEVDGLRFAAHAAWLIPARQDQYRLLSSLLDPAGELPMETFYDVSAWPLDRAYDLPLVRVRRLPAAAGELAAIDLPPPPAPNEQAVAWLVAWNQLGAPATLAALLAEGYRVQVSMEAIEIATSDGPRRFPRGSLVVHPGLQPPVGKSVVGRLGELSRRHGVRVFGVERGLSLSGPDLGSPSVPVLTKPRIGLLTGDGVNSYHAGSIWHWFDVRLGQAVAQLDTHRLTRIDLSAYTHLIVPDGAYGPLGEAFTEQLAGFVRDGGTLIAARSAATWVEGLGLNWNFVAADSESEENPAARRDYADFDLDFARTLIGGSALLIDLDPTHPLGFGYQRRELAVFRRGAHILKRLENAYAQAAVYADSPLAGGYLGEQTAADLAGSPALDVSLHGRGRVIRMADDYLFRGYWRGAERLFANALFFAELIEPTEMPADRTAQTGDGP